MHLCKLLRNNFFLRRLSDISRIRNRNARIDFYATSVNNLIHLIAYSILLPSGYFTWKRNLISMRIMFCFLRSLRIGSYDVTRLRDKWITIDYAHRTEINWVTIVKDASKNRTTREKERNGKRRKKVLIPAAASSPLRANLKRGKDGRKCRW